MKAGGGRRHRDLQAGKTIAKPESFKELRAFYRIAVYRFGRPAVQGTTHI
jgi:hypothetical protein